MRSHNVTCHPTQVNSPRFNPSQIDWYSINLPRSDKRLSWPRWLVTYRDSYPAPIQVLTRPSVNQLRLSDTMRYRYANVFVMRLCTADRMRRLVKVRTTQPPPPCQCDVVQCWRLSTRTLRPRAQRWTDTYDCARSWRQVVQLTPLRWIVQVEEAHSARDLSTRRLQTSCTSMSSTRPPITPLTTTSFCDTTVRVSFMRVFHYSTSINYPLVIPHDSPLLAQLVADFCCQFVLHSLWFRVLASSTLAGLCVLCIGFF